MNSLIGSVIGERYRIVSKLGDGGFGSVFAAQHIKTQALVAVKILKPEVAAIAEVRERFQNEVYLLGKLNHPHIVHIHDCGETADAQPFMVTELLEGEDLDSRLNRDSRLPLPDVLEIAEQVSRALSAAHEAGVIHRDIKPNNLFLIRCPALYGAANFCKVLDFGIAKFRRDAPLTARNEILGTPAFMPPEAIKGISSAIDARSDQWSLAVVLYRALAGRLPFVGCDVMATLYQVLEQAPPPLSELRPELPANVAAAIMRGLTKEPSGRFPSIADFMYALKAEPVQVAAKQGLVRRARWQHGLFLSGLMVSMVVAGGVLRGANSGPRDLQVKEPRPAEPSRPAPACLVAGSPAVPAVPALASRPADAAPPSRTGNDHAVRAVRGKSPPTPGLRGVRPAPVRTSKEDIHALFGNDYVDLPPGDSVRVR